MMRRVILTFHQLLIVDPGVCPLPTVSQNLEARRFVFDVLINFCSKIMKVMIYIIVKAVFFFYFQVLGTETPKKKEDHSQSFRLRSGSSKFINNIFPDKPVTKKNQENYSDDKSRDERISSSISNGQCGLDNV